MKGEVFINDIDCFEEYGIFFEESALSSLIIPSSTKESPEDESPLLDGKIVDSSNPKLESRSISITMNMTAESLEDFFENLESFCENVLYKKSFNIRVKYFPTKRFRFLYESCSQFREYSLTGAAKFVLRLTEPNPRDREL